MPWVYDSWFLTKEKMNIKLIGYGASLLGLLGLVLSTKKVMASSFFLAGLSPKFILIPSVILIGVGIVLTMSSNKTSNIGKEVPIYKGKEIIGYRIVK